MPIASYLGDADVIMSIPGRIRISIPQLYRSEKEKTGIEEEFAACKYVISVYASTLTARVLILFDPAVPLREVFPELDTRESMPREDGNQVGMEHSRPDSSPGQHTSPAGNGTASKRQIYPPWHLYDKEAAIEFFDSSQRFGLAAVTVAERLRDGLNLLPVPQVASSLGILINQFKSLPVLLLGVSALLSAATGTLPEAAAIIAVLALNGGIGFVTERRAQAAIASLSELVDDVVPVLRDAIERQVETSHIVPGDVLVLAPGTRVAADARLLLVNGLSVDESTLTGESMPVAKSAATLAHSLPLADRINMIYRGSAVSMGTGLALVIGTGKNTEIGAIQALMVDTEHPKTPIQKQLDRLGSQLVKASLVACAGVFALGILRRYGWSQMLKTSISLAIAALPEGLPAVATTSLARGIHSMREKNVLIRRLHAVETIGAIQTICLDKTGTLTMNRMSAVAVQTEHHHFENNRDKLALQVQGLSNLSDVELSRLLTVCVLCNQAELNGEDHALAGNGSSTENALIQLAIETGFPVWEMRNRHTLLKTDLRAEGHNYMSTIHTIPDSRIRLIATKGNPIEVLNLCRHYQSEEQVVELDADRRNEIRQRNQRMAEQQLRVLGFAYAEISSAEISDTAAENLVWLGLVGLADPLRSGMHNLISSFHNAGIRTVMLTGDQAPTAYAIGKSLGLHNGDELHIVNSEHIEEIEPQLLQRLTGKADIFSRVSPSHKLKIVQALQADGKVIAMTGDGVNDGPALQAADLGIAMGHGGTDLARSAADLVLKDDRLESLLEAISQGRTISNNIKKSLHFLLSSNLSEILVVLGSIAVGSGHPLSPMQLLWLNLLSDVLPAVALTAEPAEADVMEQMPRDPATPIIGKSELLPYAREGSCLAGGALAAYWYGTLRYGQGAQAGTMAFNSLILGQLLHALSCRSDRHGIFSNSIAEPNRQLNIAVGASIGLQILANVIPGLRRMLGIGSMAASDILVTLAAAGIPLVLNEAAKYRASDRRSSKLPATTHVASVGQIN